MSCTQTNLFLPDVKFGAVYCPSRSSYFCCTRLNISAISKGQSHKVFPRLVYSQPRYQRFDPQCSAIGNPNRENKDFSWESSKEDMGGMGQEHSVQDLLREQMCKYEYGGNGGHPRGGGDGSGGPGDEGSSETMDEIMQVVLATIGFIFVYTYLIRGAELTRLARDYINYLLGGTASMRLIRTMEKLADFYTSIDISRDLLKRAIVSMPTLWHNPRKLAEFMRFGGC